MENSYFNLYNRIILYAEYGFFSLFVISLGGSSSISFASRDGGGSGGNSGGGGSIVGSYADGYELGKETGRDDYIGYHINKEEIIFRCS